MLLGFMKNRITEAGSDPMSEIEIMLESTWDLTMTHSVKNEVPEARAVNAFNNFFKKLNRTITSLLRNIVALAALAPELTAFSKTFRQLAGEQDVKVSDIAEAGDRITLGIEDISTSTGDLNQKFTAMKVDVETAMNQGKLSMTGFNEIKSQVSILVDTIRVLRDNSASIGSISDTINAISDETNILSLNARIEAARGQSDGKGFKVIAEEVGLLAKQSKAATNDIKARLELLG
ncbi:MAG: methyl-accepting chemotaxis protein, partial [Desulfobacter sp.]